MEKSAFTVALVAVVCLVGSCSAASAAVNAQAASTAHSGTGGRCPSQAQINLTLANASTLMQQGSFREAADILAPLSTRQCDPRVSLLLAGAYEASGNLPGAEQTLERGHAEWPAHSSIAASLAREYMANQQVDKAAQALAHFRPTPATPLQELQVAVVVFIASHQLVAAQTSAQAAYKADPSAGSLVTLANTMQLQGKFKDVVALLNPKRTMYAESSAFLITLAESEYDSILYDAARDDLQHAIAVDPSSYQAHYLLANAVMKLGSVDQAISEYRLAIGLSPEEPRTYCQLALALQSEQDQAGAEEQLKRALSIDSHYGPALIEMARIRLSQNHPGEAVTQLNLAIAENPNSEQAYFLLAKAYAQLGDQPKSEEMAKRLVSVRNANWKSTGHTDKNEDKNAAIQ